MAKAPKPAAHGGRQSVHERHFAKAGRTSSQRRVRKPVPLADPALIGGITYPAKMPDGTDLVLPGDALRRMPAIAADLAAGYSAIYRSNRPVAVLRQYWRYLGEFAQYLAGVDGSLALEDLRRHHITGFRKWLDAGHAAALQLEAGAETQVPVEADVPAVDAAAAAAAPPPRRREKATRSLIVNAVQKVLKQTGKCEGIDFVKRPYVSVGGANLRATKRKPAKAVPRPSEAGRILRAALKEMEATMTLRAAFVDPSHPANDDPETRHTLALARRIHGEFGCSLPDGDALQRLASVGAGAKSGTKRAVSAFMPTLATLAPFCIILMVALRLDGQMLGDAQRANVKLVEHLGVERLQAKVWRTKIKAWRTTTATLSRHWHSPEKLVEFIDDWTTELRSAAPQKLAGRMLLASALSSRATVGLTGKNGIGRAITDFCARNGLQHITSSIPRKLAIELGDLLSGGDIAIRARIGSHNEQVDLENYDTTDAAARGDDAFGVGLMLISAHRHNARAVPDKRTFMPHEDVLAATPGWWCSSPFDPPPGFGRASKGPCSAYGACPACPHGEPDLDDPVSCARTFLLLEAVLRSEPNMPPEVWEGTWKPVADELKFKYIPMFKSRPEVMAAAAELDIGPMMEVVNAQHR